MDEKLVKPIGIRKSAFIKVSGDLCTSEKFLKQVSKLVQKYFVVICVGAGKQINEAFEEAGLYVGKHGPLGRECEDLKSKQLARDILEINQAELQDALADRGITATVVIPVLNIGTVLCHVNGDQFLKAAYLGFDMLYVVTLKNRKEAKKEEFKYLPKIKIMAI